VETDKKYFIEGLFIIGLSVAAALFAVWLANTGRSDDVTYRIRFGESVSGLALGDPVKFRGVDVGKVDAMALDSANPRLVQVDVRLRKDTPVRTDTKASLKLKGITGTVYIELDGGSPDAKLLASAAPGGALPEIAYQKSGIATLEDELPVMVKKFSVLEDRANKVISDVSGVTSQIKEDPSVLLHGPKEKPAASAEPARSATARSRTFAAGTR
jgi:phospholipid/cholesterol/gamma-HCH transport system substrate-binding protein